MRWQVGGTSNDAGLCCKAFKPRGTLQAILILAARQWGFLLGGQAVHQGIWESEALATSHSCCLSLQMLQKVSPVAILTFYREQLTAQCTPAEAIRSWNISTWEFLVMVQVCKSTEESQAFQSVVHLLLHTLQIWSMYTIDLYQNPTQRFNQSNKPVAP